MIAEKPLLEPLYEITPCPWSPEHPRHDHQLIFALDEERLVLVWSEYYAISPSQTQRTPFAEGGFGDEFPCRLSAKTSIDGGRTWGATFTIQENTFPRNVKHPNLIRLGNGDLLFTFSAWESDRYRNIFCKRSPDNLETWSEILQISEPGWYCTNNDHILRLSTGRILLPSHGGPGFDFRPGNPLHSFVFYSDDDFRTWHLSEDTMTAPGRGAHEPSIVELRDGRLLCLLRTTEGCVHRSFSADQGVHWSAPQPTPLEAPDSPPLLCRIPSTGDLLVVWNNIKSHTGRPRTPLTAAISRDEGESWGGYKDIDNRPDTDAAYASILFRGDEMLLAYYTRKHYWARDTEVLLRIYSVGQLYG